MPVIKISVADLKSAEIMNPNWYKGEVTSFEQKASSSGDSINFIPTVKFENGKELKHYFNSKAMGMMVGFIEACLDKKVDKDAALEIDSDNLVGKSIQCKVITDTYEGRLQNKMADFLPMSVDASAVPF